MKKHFFTALLWVSAAAWCFGQTNFALGSDLFLRNKPDEAAAYFEKTVVEEPDHVQAFLYLGIVYEQLNRANDAIGIYRQILDRAGDLTANVANNLGNAYFNTGNNAQAESSYTQAIAADQSFAPAWLGRANTRLRAGAVRGAIADYEQYLLLEPDTPQRGAIEQVLSSAQVQLANAPPPPPPRRPLDVVSESVQSVADVSEDDYE